MNTHRDQHHRYVVDLFELDRQLLLTPYIYSSPPTPPS